MKTPLDILKALSDLNRLRVVSALSQYEELCACQITELLQVTGATASRHLSVLQQAGLVKSRKEGRWVYYRLVPTEADRELFAWLEGAFVESDAMREDLRSLQRIVETTREELCRKQRGEQCCPK